MENKPQSETSKHIVKYLSLWKPIPCPGFWFWKLFE